MRTSIVVALLLAAPALAEEYVAPSPTPADVGRYVVVHDGDSALRLDTMTGTTWFLCEKKKGSAWCRGKEISGLTAGPAGRYRLVDVGWIALLDTVSGRTWKRCAPPTGEKIVAWCALEE
ncbi:MAG: hypothetical protein AB1938_05020 [Myxococcota bacterium]